MGEAVVPELERFEKPSVVDYGSLADLTAAGSCTSGEDGQGKISLCVSIIFGP